MIDAEIFHPPNVLPVKKLTFQDILHISNVKNDILKFQGNSFKCWAFATASMIRSTLRDAVSKSKRIPELEKAAIYESIKAINHKVNLLKLFFLFQFLAFAMRNNDERDSDESKREFGRSSIGDAASRDEKTD
jgi:hypothetical protein